MSGDLQSVESLAAKPTYLVPCRDCDGKGTTDGKTACPRCEGGGKVRSPSPVGDVA